MANTVEYYLSKGFDHKAAEYFAGGKKKIVGVVANRDFTLTISFDNGENGFTICDRFSKKVPFLSRSPIWKISAGSM